MCVSSAAVSALRNRGELEVVLEVLLTGVLTGVVEVVVEVVVVD